MRDPALRQQLPVLAGDLLLGVRVVAVGADGGASCCPPRSPSWCTPSSCFLNCSSWHCSHDGVVGERVVAGRVRPSPPGAGSLVPGVAVGAAQRPLEPWTDAAHAFGSIVTSLEEPSLNETDEPGWPWQSRHSWARAGAPRQQEGRPQEKAGGGIESEGLHGGPRGRRAAAATSSWPCRPRGSRGRRRRSCPRRSRHGARLGLLRDHLFRRADPGLELVHGVLGARPWRAGSSRRCGSPCTRAWRRRTRPCLRRRRRRRSSREAHDGEDRYGDEEETTLHVTLLCRSGRFRCVTPHSLRGRPHAQVSLIDEI